MLLQTIMLWDLKWKARIKLEKGEFSVAPEPEPDNLSRQRVIDGRPCPRSPSRRLPLWCVSARTPCAQERG